MSHSWRQWLVFTFLLDMKREGTFRNDWKCKIPNGHENVNQGTSRGDATTNLRNCSPHNLWFRLNNWKSSFRATRPKTRQTLGQKAVRTFLNITNTMDIGCNWTLIWLYRLRIESFESQKCYQSNGTLKTAMSSSKSSKPPTDPTRKCTLNCSVNRTSRSIYSLSVMACCHLTLHRHDPAALQHFQNLERRQTDAKSTTSRHAGRIQNIYEQIYKSRIREDPGTMPQKYIPRGPRIFTKTDMYAGDLFLVFFFEAHTWFRPSAAPTRTRRPSTAALLWFHIWSK